MFIVPATVKKLCSSDFPKDGTVMITHAANFSKGSNDTLNVIQIIVLDKDSKPVVHQLIDEYFRLSLLNELLKIKRDSCLTGYIDSTYYDDPARVKTPIEVMNITKKLRIKFWTARKPDQRACVPLFRIEVSKWIPGAKYAAKMTKASRFTVEFPFSAVTIDALINVLKSVEN